MTSGLPPALRVDATVHRSGFALEAALAVPAGRVLGIVGPNGAGKSTLLHAVLGDLPIAAGSVEIGGRVVDAAGGGRAVPIERRRVGMVFQQPLLIPHLSVLDNVAFGPRAHGAPRHEAAARARSWLECLGIAGLARRRPHELSGGEAQRAAIARALAADPEVLLLDEPLAALDVEARTAVREHLAVHLGGFRGAVLLVSHHPADLALADRVLVLEGGRVVQEGALAQLAEAPATDFVARLLAR
ncbi:ABC transporter ATP-binding protein [Microcella flavibacter]|uniref:ABC transporter ATP-binding protein n=1 Tax=Microcella flavibacter TaxID=1804990 RepID=UPI0014568E12|nr:ATP-binding cassette domain-containing protein [Microcella flavibacter]